MDSEQIMHFKIDGALCMHYFESLTTTTNHFFYKLLLKYIITTLLFKILHHNNIKMNVNVKSDRKSRFIKSFLNILHTL